MYFFIKKQYLLIMKQKFNLTETELKKLLVRIVTEALKPSQFREYVKDFNRERYYDIFKTLGDKYQHDKNYYRIYIPLEASTPKGPVSNIQKEVTKFLEENGYEVIDYVKGTAKYGDSKNITSIGKILTRLKSEVLMNRFVSDESRKALTSNSSNLMVVLSRHPYDIAGSDTDRNWTNCMTMGHSNSPRVKKLTDELKDLEYKLKVAEAELANSLGVNKDNFDVADYEHTKDFSKSPINKLLNKIDDINYEIKERTEEGQNVRYLRNDVKEGSLISYLIKNDDKNIQNPIAVLNIKPYVNNKNKKDFILISDNRMYGQGRPEFKTTVDSILESINGLKYGLFCLKGNLYDDDMDRSQLRMSPKQKKSFEESYNDLLPTVISLLPEYISKNIDEIFENKVYEESDSLEDEGFTPEEISRKIIQFRKFFLKKRKELINSLVGTCSSYLNEYNKDDLMNEFRSYLSKTDKDEFDINDFAKSFLDDLNFYDLMVDSLYEITQEFQNN